MTADSKPVGGSGGGAAVAPPQSKKALLELVSRLTREHIAPRAAEYDAAGTNPIDSWRVLGRDGFLASCIPTAYGGLGLDMPTYIGVIRTIARGCANTAMTVHMHSTVMRFIDALGTDAQKRRYFAEVVEHGRLFGSWGSEPAVSLSRSFLMETVVRQDRDAYVVDGVKHFCTMPADAPGIATDGKWNTLGMRATFSPSVTFTGVRVAKDTALGDPGTALRVGVVESFALGYAAVYAGIAEGALAFAIDYAKQRIVKPENAPVAHDPAVQRHIGELAAHLDAARLVLADTAERWEAADVQERGVLGNKAKYIATEVGLAVTSKVIQVVGGRGAYKDFPAERAFRDLRTSTLMPPTVDRMLEGIAARRSRRRAGLDE